MRERIISTSILIGILYLAPSGQCFSATSHLSLKQKVVSNYAQQVFDAYSLTYQKAEILHSKIDLFLAAPTAQRLEEAKLAWIEARKVYGQTEVYRFYQGPIDDANGPEGRMNAWPLDEVYIDYVVGQAESGIINKPALYPKITEKLLLKLNESGSEKNIATGFHAIEFLLWGQDFNTSAPGQRPYTDFVVGASGTAKNQARRAEYLKVVSTLLIKDLILLVAQWNPEGKNNYFHFFVKQPVDDAIKSIMTGMLYLSGVELSGERMYVAYETGDQEDEQSCFSDTTHLDLIANRQGIVNVWSGSLEGKSYSGLNEFFKVVDPKLYAQMNLGLTQSLSKLSAVPRPFDSAINSNNKLGRLRLLEAVESLELISKTIANLAKALNIEIKIANH